MSNYHEIVIQSGDSLFGLFQEQWLNIYNDIKNEELRSIAPNPDRIQPGQSIYVHQQFEKYPKIKILLEDAKRAKQNWNSLSGIEKFEKAIKLEGISYPIYNLQESITNKKEYFLFSTHSKNNTKSINQLDGITLEFNLCSLFKKIKQGLSCYWIAIEPFNFFLDIDGEVDLDKLIPILESHFNYYLICNPNRTTEEHYRKMKQKYPNYPQHRTSYSVFTNTQVFYEDAIYLETEIASQLSSGQTKKIVNRFNSEYYDFPEGPVDSMFATMSPIVYRRSPFSLHGWYKDRISIPRFCLSNLPIMSDLEILRFSNPNKSYYGPPLMPHDKSAYSSECLSNVSFSIKSITKPEWEYNKRLSLHERNHRKIILSGYPLAAQVDLGHFCNQRCLHCSHTLTHNKNKKVSFDDIKILANMLRYSHILEFGVRAETFACAQEFLFFLEEFRKINTFSDILICTNGKNVSKYLKEIFDFGITHIFFSIHSDDRQNYKKICGSNDYDNILETIKKISDYKRQNNKKLPVLHIVSILWEASNPFSIIDLARETGATDVGFLRFHSNDQLNKSHKFLSRSITHTLNQVDLSKLLIDLIDYGNESKIFVRFPHMIELKKQLPPETWGRLRAHDVGPGNLVEYNYWDYYTLKNIQPTNSVCLNDNPWIKLFFDVYDVNHCAFGTNFTTWKNQHNIKSIWNHNHMQRIRKTITNNIMPKCCFCQRPK